MIQASKIAYLSLARNWSTAASGKSDFCLNIYIYAPFPSFNIIDLTANYWHATRNFTYYSHATPLLALTPHATLLLALALHATLLLALILRTLI
jgi:hypothetical protein